MFEHNLLKQQVSEKIKDLLRNLEVFVKTFQLKISSLYDFPLSKISFRFHHRVTITRHFFTWLPYPEFCEFSKRFRNS